MSLLAAITVSALQLLQTIVVVQSQAAGMAGRRIVDAASGVSAVSLGCFHDSCGADCGGKPRVQARVLGIFPSAKCSGYDVGCSVAPAAACPDRCSHVCTASVAETCPADCSPDACDDEKMTPEYCIAQCHALRQRYGGIEAGNQCFCGNEIR
eukprot:SAG31_NODE_16729_length_698_cov_1.045075_2_plen_153_part_00